MSGKPQGGAMSEGKRTPAPNGGRNENVGVGLRMRTLVERGHDDRTAHTLAKHHNG